MDFDVPYLTKQIIAYIGNKRKLLSLIYKALEASGLDLAAPLRFADLFSGSGVVSRFAKQLGFEVHCNDWEPYAEVLSRGFIALDRREFEALFAAGDEGGEGSDGASAHNSAFDGDSAPACTGAAPSPATSVAPPASPAAFRALVAEMQALAPPTPEDCYISRYYAAHSDDVTRADFRTERLFYTRQNALAIDNIRTYIERHFPDKADKRRHVLLALLLYEAATHTNTSGVFKAFHKGFGGHGKDALSRILSPIALHEPVLIDARAPVYVYRKDANELVRELAPMDVVYVDPPYNQHQYGSNYHLLNTIALWDKIPEPLDVDENGVLINKAAIRRDWVQTRSAYCYKKSAATAFRDLIAHIRARLILVSYSSDGIIPFEEMKAICLQKGYVSIVTSDYVVYRGGKQSNSRKSADIEFVLAIDTSRPARAECAQHIDKVLLERRLLLLLKRRYNTERLMQHFSRGDGARLLLTVGERRMAFIALDAITLALATDEDPARYTNSELEAACRALEACACQTKQEELATLIALTAANADGKAAHRYGKLIPATLKKLAQKKYRSEFYAMLAQVRALAATRPLAYTRIVAKLDELVRTAEIRFTS